MNSIENIQTHTDKLYTCMKDLIGKIGDIPIGKKSQFPYGWRKSAKGRTVWRIVEEVINQNLERYYPDLDIAHFEPSESEVSVYDAILRFNNDPQDIHINFKTAVSGGRTNKDDISKAIGLQAFFEEDLNREIYIATFEITFTQNMAIDLSSVYVMPVMWLPDIYVNPSNNGNLQSSKYKDLTLATKRTTRQFYQELIDEIEVARQKRAAKRKKLRQTNMF
jgi:hypothetical protein